MPMLMPITTGLSASLLRLGLQASILHDLLKVSNRADPSHAAIALLSSLRINPELGAVLCICKGPFALEVVHPQGPAQARFKSDVCILR